MGTTGRRVSLILLAALFVSRAAAGQIEDLIDQVSLGEYQSYLRVLTGVDPVPGNPPYYLTNRYSLGQDIHVAGDWLQNQFASFGLNATQHTYNAPYGPNVIGELPGTTRPQDIYIISGHYDTFHYGDQSHAPGCNDDGSGTAAVLMAARILSQYSFEGTLRFVAFSGEEQWMVGSSAYAFHSYVWGENIAGVINLDMILHPGFDNQNPDPDYDLDIETDENSLWLAEYLAGQYATYTPLTTEILVDPDSASDHWAFWQYSYDAVGLSENTTDEIWGGSNDTYHQLTDTIYNPDNDWEFGLQTIRGAMAGAAGLAGVVPEPSPTLAAGLLSVLATLRRRR